MKLLRLETSQNDKFLSNSNKRNMKDGKKFRIKCLKSYLVENKRVRLE